MTIENKEYSKNDLEHVKFTKDSTKDNSIVQTSETNQDPLKVRHKEIFVLLDNIHSELVKLNTYFAIGMDHKL